jgi:hypothetical protein
MAATDYLDDVVFLLISGYMAYTFVLIIEEIFFTSKNVFSCKQF